MGLSPSFSYPIACIAILAWLGAAVPAAGSGPQAPEIQVAAAADLKFAMDEMILQFQRLRPDLRVRAAYGSSGNFFAQLANGAPFDLFFSADVSYPLKLVEQGLVLDDSVLPYAFGRLAVWAPLSSPIDVGRLGMEALRHESVRHVAIANPRHAPYGKAAESAIRSAKLYDVIQPKLVFGENAAQALQFIESGAAEIGIVAYALIQAPGVRDKGRYWEVPRDRYPLMEQACAIMKRSTHPGLARDFRSFVLGERGRLILNRYGFNLPGD